MDSAATRPSPVARSFRPSLVAVGLLMALLAYGVLLTGYTGGYAGGSDSSGYLNMVRLFREGRLQVTQRTIEGLPADTLPPSTYLPLGFVALGSDQMTPMIPVGFPLLVTAVSLATGPDYAPHVTIWLHALAGVILMYALARGFGFSRLLAAVGGLLLAASPAYLFTSVQALSDTPALVWTAAAIYFSWLSRDRAAWAFAAGGSVALAVLVRPTNLLVMAPVALCLGRSPRAWFGLIAGGLPGAVFVSWLNFRLFGHALSTGYGNIWALFGWDAFPLALKNYVTWLPVVLTPLLPLALALPWLARREPKPSLLGLLAVWALIFVGFYAFYFPTSDAWWYLRFLLPAFPPVILAMLWSLQALLRRLPVRLAVAVTLLAAGGALAWDGWWTVQTSALRIGQVERVFLQTARWAQTHLPANAVIVGEHASGTFMYYSEFTFLRQEFITPATLPRIEQACARAGRPIYAALFPFEVQHALVDCLPGQWTQVGAVRQVTFWRRDGPVPQPVAPVEYRELTSARFDEIEAIAQVSSEWYNLESSLKHEWVWSPGRGALEIETWPADSRKLALTFSLRSLAPSTVTVSQDGVALWRGPVARDYAPVTVEVQVNRGTGRIQFASDTPGTLESSAPDARRLAFAIRDVKIRRSGEP